MTNEFNNMNRRDDEDHEEFRIFEKEYVYREERKESNDLSFREDIYSLVQQITKLKRDLHNIQKSMKTIKHDSLQTFPESFRLYAIVQWEIINRSDISSLGNDMPIIPTRG